MVTINNLREIAISFPETTEEEHFEKTSFRVKKKIFATFDETNNRASVKLSKLDQHYFSANHASIYPVPNKWGQHGWTFVALNTVDKELLKDVLTTAYCEVAPKTLLQQVTQNKHTYPKQKTDNKVD